MIGRVTRETAAWDARVALAEALNADVVTDLKVGAAFPTDHPLHVAPPSIVMQPGLAQAIAGADVILSLDWVDLAGTLQSACGGEPAAKVIQVSQDHVLHNGWSMDHQAHPPVDVFIAAEPDTAVDALREALGTPEAREYPRRESTFATTPAAGDVLTTDDLAGALRAAVGKRRVSLSHLPLSWNGACWPFRHPLDFLGSDGGGGIGAGPGIAVGAALALRGSGVLPVAVCGDGDFLMGATALWTAVHYRIPVLIVVANNRSFYNDEVHQERVARARHRPVENKWIGQRMTDPEIDLAALGRAQGATGWGPIVHRDELGPAFEAAIDAVERGHVAVVDVRVEPGYTPALAAQLSPLQGERRGSP
jgi:thiamine pyrophosphate-dependent acetolactate synthase large subunit-like protein